jgi:hypothetical protein
MRFLVLTLVAACHADVQPARVLTPAPSASATVTASPTVRGRVAITVAGPGAFEIENTGAAPMKVATVAHIEDGDGASLALDLDKGYRLLEQCPTKDEHPDACVEIAPGATLHPVPWTGFGCNAQCNPTCRANTWEGGGRFRLVVKSCDGADTFASPEFPIPHDSRLGPFARAGLTMDVASATVARLELPTQEFALGAPATPDHIAGFKVRPGTEKPLDRALVDKLLALMLHENGFDDQIAKRCLMTDLVGVRLLRHPRTTGAPKTDVVEIAFDQTCSKFFAVRGDATHRVEMATHYDPQRPAFLAWAKRALTSP